MSAAGMGVGGGGPGSGAGSGACNPRKFSEKIALHTQRQAEDTAAFQEVMMDITSTRIQAQKLRVAQIQGPYYGGSLPNVNQIGRHAPDQFPSSLESGRSTRHHGLVERVHRDRRFTSPVRPYRRQTDSLPYSPAYLSPPPDPSWRRNWSSNFPVDKHQLIHLPISALNRTNSDSALHTSVMNPLYRDPLSTHALNPHNRHSGLAEGEGRKMFPYPVPPIEENVLDEGKVLKPWDTKKLPILSSRPKSCEVPGINIFPSPDQPSSTPHIPAALNAGGSLPDLTTLHFPSPLPTPLDRDEPPYPSLSGGSSTGSLGSTHTQLGISSSNAFHLPGLSASLQGKYCNPLLQSSHSNPNIQSSLSSHSFPNSLSSTSLHSSLSNPSLRSPLSSCPSLQSSLSNQSLQSSLSNSSLSGQSIQSAASNPSFGSGAGGSGSCSSSSYPSLATGTSQPSLTTSPRRRTQLSPLVLPIGGGTGRHHPKQFSPTISPTLSSITQGVPLDTSKPAYPYSQPQTAPPLSHQSMKQSGQQHQQQHLQQQQQHHQQQQQHHQQQQKILLQQHQTQQQQIQPQQHHTQQQQQQHHTQQQQIQQQQHQTQQQQMQQQQHQTQQQQIQQQQHQTQQQQMQQQQHQTQQQQIQQQQHQTQQQQIQQQQHQTHQQQIQQQQHQTQQQQIQQQQQQTQQQQIQQQQHHTQQQQIQQQQHHTQQLQQHHMQQQQMQQQQIQQQHHTQQQQIHQQQQQHHTQQIQQQQQQHHTQPQKIPSQQQQQMQQQLHRQQQQIQQQMQQQHHMQQQQIHQQMQQQQHQTQQIQQQQNRTQQQQMQQQQQLPHSQHPRIDLQRQLKGMQDQAQCSLQEDNQQRALTPTGQLQPDLSMYNDPSILGSFLDDPCLGLQLTPSQGHTLSQQLEKFNMEVQMRGQSFNHGQGSESLTSSGNAGSCPGDRGSQETQRLVDPQLLNRQNQELNQSYGDDTGCPSLPNIILTGDSSTGLSKEITSALSGMPGFEVDPFGLDDPLRMDPLALEGLSMLAEGDLMLPDPSVEDSFRSDRLN